MPQPQPVLDPAADPEIAIPCLIAACRAEGATLAPLIAREIGHTHVLMQRLAIQAKQSADRIGSEGEPLARCRLARRFHRFGEASGRLLDGVRLGAVALARLQAIGRVRAERRKAKPPLPSTGSLPAERRGRLKNGNPAGDYLAAPRCGAKTRAGGCCRQPAMVNGRCRMHGGRSTGPRTAAGCVASRRARLGTGRRSAAGCAIRAVDNAARSLARLHRLQHRYAPLLAAMPALPSTPCQAASGPSIAMADAVGATGSRASSRVPLSRLRERDRVRVRANGVPPAARHCPHCATG